MRRIAFLFLGLCLTAGMIGCSDDATNTDGVDTPTATDTEAGPAGDADGDGDANATDAAPAEDAAK